MIDEDPHPLAQVRADILTEALWIIATASGEIGFPDVFSGVMDSRVDPTEAVSYEILAAITCLVRSGVVECNAYDGHSLTLAESTKLKASWHLKSYVFDGLLSAQN